MADPAVNEDLFKPATELGGASDIATPHLDAESEIQPKKVKVRQARKVEGVFETGVDVVE